MNSRPALLTFPPAPALAPGSPAGCRVVAVRAGLPPTEPDAEADYLVCDGGEWVAARWARRPGDREAGWRFWGRGGQALRPTHYLSRPALPEGAVCPAPGDRLAFALPSGVAVGEDGRILSDMPTLAQAIRDRLGLAPRDDWGPRRAGDQPEGSRGS